MLPTFFQPLAVVLALSVGTSYSQAVTSLVSRRVTEYLLPVAKQTHEIAKVPGSNFLLVSQMSNSKLLKVELDPDTEEPIAYQSFPMGESSKSGLHGVWPSTKFPGMVWLSLQSENKLLLVDPGTTLSDVPTILTEILIPHPGNGPHSIFEIGNHIWAGLKDASPQTGQYYAFSADIDNPSETALYPCLNSPVFIQQEPTTGLIYLTQDTSSSIMRIDTAANVTEQLPIPPSVGVNPVGMITVPGPSPLAGLWFVLAGNSTGGTGTFGRIHPSGDLQFFTLTSPLIGTGAAFLHLADASTPEEPALWLLATSLLSPNSPDALVRVTFDEDVTEVAGEEFVALPTQNAWAHRIAVLETTVMVSELHTFSLAQLAYEGTAAGRWVPSRAVTDEGVYEEEV
ncbi:hypothetical protein QBC34DRAFT_152025 [Podospora aff. communis PSN243]|uniref:Uncharacterized protein n=1 Tax=Podospora aff. communis PSN243 TaxID=3040156 RepID=A0AAV9GCL5_9PEZI|nr:hypothetical protein QBC34DRAFT_152025 [Podospora aff. communis PSN243]